MTKRILLAICAASTLAASGSLDAPRKGCVLDAGEGVRMVFGTRSNFALGEPLFAGALDAACSDRFIVVRTESALTLAGSRGSVLATVHTAAGPAVLGFGASGEEALAWLAEPRQLWRSSGAEWEQVEFPVNGEVLAIAGGGSAVAALVRRDDGIWLVKIRGAATEHEERIAESATAAFLTPAGAILLAEGAALHIRDPLGATRTIEFPAPARSIHAMNVAASGGCLRIELDGLRIALELEHGIARTHMLAGGAR